MCILLKKGIRWSNTFEYYDKVTPDSSDPVKATKYDKQLMWGAISERSLDLGGLAVDDVPGATVYKPPSKSKVKRAKARRVLRKMSRPVELSRIRHLVEAKSKLNDAKEAQSHAVTLEGETRDIVNGVKVKLQHLDDHNTKASLHAAKMNLAAAMSSKVISKQTAKYMDVKSQADEFSKAAKAFADADNPMAEVMRRKAVKWNTKAAHYKEMLGKAKAKYEIENMQAKMSEADAAHWHQQSDWASADEAQAQKQLKAVTHLKQSADDMLAAKAHLAKEAKWKAYCHPSCDGGFRHPNH